MGRVRTSQPLDEWTARIFLVEIEQRCREALVGDRLLQEGMATGDRTLMWFALRSILFAGASISQLTGGRKGPSRQERSSIRRALGINDRSVLHNRAVRDSAEHIDERILRAYGPGQPRIYYAGYEFGASRGLFGLAPLGRDFLHFDWRRGTVTFWEDEVSITDVVAEIGRIRPLAEAAAREPWNIPGLQRKRGLP